MFTRDKCSWGLKTESLVDGLIQGSLKAVESLLPSMDCGLGPQPGLIYPARRRDLYWGTRAHNTHTACPYGRPALLPSFHPTSIQPVLRATVVAPRMFFVCSLSWPQNAHLTPAKSHTLLGNIANVPWQCAWPDFDSVDEHPNHTAFSRKIHGTRCCFAEDTAV